MKKGMSLNLRTFLAMVAVMILAGAPLASGAAGALPRVAAESAAAMPADSFVSQGDTYTYPVSAIPAAKLAKDAGERTVYFDHSAVTLLCLGADRKAHYEIELTFLSDSAVRAVAVAAGGKVIEKKLELPFAQVVTRRYPVPAAATHEGELEIQVRRLAGPNAVLTAFAVYSDSPAPLRPYVAPKTVPALAPLRLTPRPAAVAGVAATSASLSGTWQFCAAPAGEFWKSPQAGAPQRGGDWKPIAVPGEWTMQGFTVEKGSAAAYRRSFAVPADWTGRRVKLRFDGVYAESRVWVNGHEAGGHAGGFTPFELDVTELIKNGQANDLALEVRGRGSKPDGLASGSQYAEHDLGGIPRKVTMFAVPEANIASLHVTTAFDQNFNNAKLTIATAIANQGKADLSNARLEFALIAPDGESIKLAPASLALSAIANDSLTTQTIAIPVASPLKWDNEHPNLYRLSATLHDGDKPLETVTQNVGFRQVEVRGNQLFLNGRAIKLRGVCRHETHPTLGRALTPELWEADARLFRDGNVNYIRTSHYPPAEEFLDWCDRLGLLVESEAPFCWAQRERLSAAEVPVYVVRPTQEMVEFNRNHPSVIIWSIGNESQKWREYFSHSAAAVLAADPSRPRNFSGSADQNVLEIAGPHYPGLAGPAKFADSPRPATFDEFIHLNCYNRNELYTDPGVRDFWGPGSLLMWEKMRQSQGTLGGAIWAAIDDSFFVPGQGVVGYGSWGPLDGWRRPKPEYWHMKKIYSPLRIAEAPLALPAPGEPLRLAVGNRHDFANLNEVRFEWKLGELTGSAHAAAAPQTTGTLELATRGADLVGQTLELRALDPRGFMIDQWNLPVGSPKKPKAAAAPQGEKLVMERYEGLIIVHSKDFNLEIDGHTGIFRNSKVGGQEVLVAGPALMVLPVRPPGDTQMGGHDVYDAFTAPCTDWAPEEVTTGQTDDGVWIKTRGAYKEAKGAFTLRFSNAGLLTVDYDFEMKEKVTPRQIGVVLDIPRFCDTFSWRRRALWTAYPPDHIGRPVGTTKAFYEGVPMMGIAGPAQQPAWPWSHDANPLGCNDFRSTKLNVEEAALSADNGAGVKLAGDGTQHVRLWADDLAIRMLIADYANEGGASFFSEHVVPDKHLVPGDRVQGTARVQFIKPGK